MNENDERLAKAAMKSLLTPAPESLKADLKRMARNRKPAPSVWDGLRGFAFGESSAWAYGAGAAFAAVALAVVIVKTLPGRSRPVESVAAAVPAASAAELAGLWSDDDGGDHD